MDQIEQNLRKDFEKRMRRLNKTLSDYSDFKVLREALTLDNSGCYRLFHASNDSLEEVEQLTSLLINCLLDDGTLVVKVDELMEGSVSFHLTWGNDDDIPVREDAVLELMEISKRQREFSNKHMSLDTTQEELKKYFSFDDDINEVFRRHLSQEQKKHVKDIESRDPFKKLKA